MMTSTKVLSGRRRGSVIVYVALALVVLLGSAGMAIDASSLYLQRDKAQRAADAAALAGAVQLRDGHDSNADAAAEQEAANNGYGNSDGATVTPKLDPNGDDPYDYRVYVSKPVPLFFMAIFGMRFKTIGASATATYEVASQVSINGALDYGTGTGPYTISQFGPWGEFNNGDCYDTKYLENGTPNPLYQPTGTTLDPTGQGGYNYNIAIPANYASVNGTSMVDLELYDPYTSGSNSQMDEYRTPVAADPDKPVHDWDTTLFRLYPPAGSPHDNVAIAIATCGETATTGSDNCGSSSSKPLTWITPTGFSFDASSYLTNGAANFRLNVETIDGSSENGYELRAGPPLPTVISTRTRNGVQQYKYIANGTTTAAWYNNAPAFNQNNGTNITATGHIEINFDQTGTSQVRMGYVPAGATSVTITKFDTDVGAQSISYEDDKGNTWPGVLNKGNGAFSTDTFNLGNGYAGGNWIVDYTAGASDTSVWNMSYTGPSLTNNGYVHLVK